MKNLLLRACAVALASLLNPSPVFAQAATSVQAPNGWAPMQAPCVKQVDGSCLPVSAANPLPVTGGSGGGSGTDPRIAQGATSTGQTGTLIQCNVVSGDQAYTAGTVQPCTLTASGRLKVGLSSATNIAPGAAPSTTLAGDLVSCVYRTPVSWTIGWQGAFQCDSAGNLMVSGNVGVTGSVAVTGTFWQATQPISGTVSVTSLGSPFQAGGSIGNTAFALNASEVHAGEIGGNQITIQVAQTVTAAAYTSGNAVGGLMTLSNAARVSAGSGLLQSVVISAKSAQTTQVDVFIFSANPTGTTCTDKTAFALASADFDKVLGVASVTTWFSGGTPSIGQSQNLAMPYALASGTTLYACAVTRSTPTYASTSDVSVGFRVLRN